MSLLVTGSIGVDTIETPFGTRDGVVGGSAVYFSYAASMFASVRLVGVIGPDYPIDLANLFKGRAVDLSGLETRAGSKSFRWHGSYLKDMNEAQTVSVDLNVLAEQAPKIPAAFLDSRYVFLANTHPQLQLAFRRSLTQAKLVVADTMNLWIETTRDDLKALLREVDGLVLNDGEARLLTGEKNMIRAARAVISMGPKFVVIKKGEHGAMAAVGNEIITLPAYPAEQVIDPTGAGDSFAAGMMGYLTASDRFDAATLRRAMAYGTVTASYTIAGFSLEGLAQADKKRLDARLETLRASMAF